MTVDDAANGPSHWVTAADVARRAGVSRSAVSRTFTAGASVSKETREKVLAAAEALGYRVNILARSMIQRQSNLVGIVVSGFGTPFLPLILAPLVSELDRRGLAPLLMDARRADNMEDSLRDLLSYRVAGAILTSGTPPIELAEEYSRLRVPVVMINRAGDFEGVDTVGSDNRRGGALAAECLLAAGARRLAYVNRPTGTHSGRERGAGFCETMGLAGAAGVSFELMDADRADYDGGVAAGRRLLDRPPERRPDGIFCSTDELAFGLIDVARDEFGLSVPGDLAVVGFDDIPMARAGAYAMTTVRQDTDGLAQRAVSRLVERMETPSLPPRVDVLPVTLVERRSHVLTSSARPSGN